MYRMLIRLDSNVNLVVPNHAYGPSTDTELQAEGIAQQGKEVRSIHEAAAECKEDQKDEAEWVEIVRMVLRAAGMSELDSMLEMNNVYGTRSHRLQLSGSYGAIDATNLSNTDRRGLNRQTQQIDSELLPRSPSMPFRFTKKADLTLNLRGRHPSVRQDITNARQRIPSLTLSHLKDAYTSRVSIVAGIEVKEPGGSSNDAILQLSIWTAAALEKVRWRLNQASSLTGQR
ncbi:hypothetical protein LTR28_006310 [Elasticomyces elasticus]|nr:hypothetical protein LTR28_006310 [Elasticomyces elasticus]